MLNFTALFKIINIEVKIAEKVKSEHDKLPSEYIIFLE